MGQPEDTVSPAKGQLFIVSAPSGAGKTTLCREILKRFPRMRYSVSHTTRVPREGEKPGKDYYFVSAEAFEAGIADGLWAEWARVHDHYYGTSVRFLDEARENGIDVLLDIDVQGTRQMIRRFPDSITVFIMPPSPEVLRRRLNGRGTESPEAIERRMTAARQEMAQRGIYRYTVVNDDLDVAVAKLADIIHCHSPRN
ncbi:MAG: guanylate kinase [Desulfobacterales bacterium]|nr:guanylate kinase [Desulfobacterales bacterium]